MKGWRLLGMHDPSGRRALWYRTRPVFEPGYGKRLWARTPRVIELRAGRDGDDDYVRLRIGQTLTPEIMRALGDVLGSQAWAVELSEIEVPQPTLRPPWAKRKGRR